MEDEKLYTYSIACLEIEKSQYCLLQHSRKFSDGDLKKIVIKAAKDYVRENLYWRTRPAVRFSEIFYQAMNRLITIEGFIDPEYDAEFRAFDFPVKKKG